jgi:hypothetical protein
MGEEDIRSRREELVREHIESENRHEFEVTMETFHHRADRDRGRLRR